MKNAPTITPSWVPSHQISEEFSEGDLIDSLHILFSLLNAQLMMMTDAMEGTDNVDGLELTRRTILDADAFLAAYCEYMTEQGHLADVKDIKSPSR